MIWSLATIRWFVYSCYMHNIISYIKQCAQDFLAPPYCDACKVLLEQRFPLCTTCHVKIQRIVPIALPITSSKKIMVHALGAYEEPLVSFIRAKQFNNHVAAEQLAQLLVHAFGEQPSFAADYLIPIPLHWRRYAARGYNQAEVMAQVMGKAWQLPVANVLRRQRHTAFQMTRAADERPANVAEAFILAAQVDATLYANKHLVLVDDLMTTGSTLSAAVKILRVLRPASIAVIVGARVL